MAYGSTTCVTKLSKSYLVTPVLERYKYYYPNWQRAARLGSAPVLAVAAALDVVLGVIAGLGAALTLGKFEKLFDVADTCLLKSKQVASKPYLLLLQSINPESEAPHFGSKISRKGNGFASDPVISKLDKAAEACAKAKFWINRHVSSRLMYGVLAVACLVTRAVDAVIAVPAVVLALMTCGEFRSLNHLGYRTTQAPGIVYDLFYCATKIINPMPAEGYEIIEH